jgi:hypothetical protein
MEACYHAVAGDPDSAADVSPPPCGRVDVSIRWDVKGQRQDVGESRVSREVRSYVRPADSGKETFSSRAITYGVKGGSAVAMTVEVTNSSSGEVLVKRSIPCTSRQDCFFTVGTQVSRTTFDDDDDDVPSAASQHRRTSALQLSSTTSDSTDELVATAIAGRESAGSQTALYLEQRVPRGTAGGKPRRTTLFASVKFTDAVSGQPLAAEGEVQKAQGVYINASSADKDPPTGYLRATNLKVPLKACPQQAAQPQSAGLQDCRPVLIAVNWQARGMRREFEATLAESKFRAWAPSEDRRVDYNRHQELRYDVSSASPARVRVTDAASGEVLLDGGVSCAVAGECEFSVGRDVIRREGYDGVLSAA